MDIHPGARANHLPEHGQLALAVAVAEPPVLPLGHVPVRIGRCDGCGAALEVDDDHAPLDTAVHDCFTGTWLRWDGGAGWWGSRYP